VETGIKKETVRKSKHGGEKLKCGKSTLYSPDLASSRLVDNDGISLSPRYKRSVLRELNRASLASCAKVLCELDGASLSINDPHDWLLRLSVDEESRESNDGAVIRNVNETIV